MTNIDSLFPINMSKINPYPLRMDIPVSVANIGECPLGQILKGTITNKYISKCVNSVRNWPFLFHNRFSTTPRLDEKPQALATARVSAAQNGAVVHIPLTRGLLKLKLSKPKPFLDFISITYYTNNMHYFLLRNSFLLPVFSQSELVHGSFVILIERA